MLKKNTAISLCVSVAIWKDALPERAFVPPMGEMARIELGRILGTTMKNRTVARHITDSLALQLQAEPWDVMEPADLLNSFDQLVQHSTEAYEKASLEVLQGAYKDAAFSMVRRRGTPQGSHNFDDMARDAVRTLRLPASTSKEVAEKAREYYVDLYKQLRCSG